MQKLITAILKTSLMPAAVMIIGKLFGLLISNSLFGLNMYISNEIKGIYTVQLFFTNIQETILANSFSNVLMLLLVGIGFVSYFARYHLYRTTTSNPRTLVKLVKLNLLGWITSNKGGVIETTVWAIFLWFSCIIIITQSINGSSFYWIGIIALLSLISSFWAITNALEIEIKNALPKEKVLY
jgi:hypothetical protein